MRVRACSGARPNIKLRGRNSVQGVDLHLSILCPQGVTSTLVSSAHKMFGDLPEHFWGKKKKLHKLSHPVSLQCIDHGG
jgi:hypothetical protein